MSAPCIYKKFRAIKYKIKRKNDLRTDDGMKNEIGRFTYLCINVETIVDSLNANVSRGVKFENYSRKSDARNPISLSENCLGFDIEAPPPPAITPRPRRW